jgi:hypothetical protein
VRVYRCFRGFSLFFYQVQFKRGLGSIGSKFMVRSVANRTTATTNWWEVRFFGQNAGSGIFPIFLATDSAPSQPVFLRTA